MHNDPKRNFTAAGALILTATAALLLASCNAGGAGIFYSLVQATPQSTVGIGDSRTIGSMALISGSPGDYYAAAGTLYTNAVGSTSPWQAVTAPAKNAAGNPYVCTSIAASGTTLYAVYYDPNADSTSTYFLYQATISGSTVSTSPSWSTVAPFDSNATFTVQSVFEVNGNILVLTMDNPANTSATEGPYSLYILGDSTPILSGLQDPPSAGTWSDNGTTVTYWFIGGNPGTSGGPKIYSGSAPSGTALSSVPLSIMSSQPSAMQTNMYYRGIYYSATLGTLFVSTSPPSSSTQGQVYAYQSGSWTSDSIVLWPSGTTLTGLNGFDEYYDSASGYDVILVGADIGGYYEIDISNPGSFSAASASTSPITLGQPGNTTTITASAAYTNLTLASAHVIGFFDNLPSKVSDSAAVDRAPSQIFALTQNGLWLNEVTSGSQRTWTLQ